MRGRIGFALIAVASPSACSDAATAEFSDAGAPASGARSGAGGAPAHPDATTGSGGRPCTTGCEPSGLSAAPLECADTWAHAAILYPRCTDVAPGEGYRGRCGDYDATVVTIDGTTTSCYYHRGTGNLTGVLVMGECRRCLSFDPAFDDAPGGACSPLGATACDGDGG